MIGIGTLAKLAKGGLSKDELLEILSQLGVLAEFGEVQEGVKKGEFESLWASASLPGSHVVRLQMRMKGGGELVGLLVARESSPKILPLQAH